MWYMTNGASTVPSHRQERQLEGKRPPNALKCVKFLKYISIFKFKRKKTKENENKIKERLNASHGVLALTTTEMFHYILNGFLAP